MKNLKIMRIYFIVLMGLFYSLNLIAQTPDGRKEILIIKSEIFKTDRKIAVFLPSNYEEIKDEKLQVIYVFDGQWEQLFNYISGATSFLSAIGELNKVIVVVGIYTEDRRKEFLPMPKSMEIKLKWEKDHKFGYSYLLDQHLLNEVFPLIEKKIELIIINLQSVIL